MSKKTAGGLLGTIVIAGVAAGVAKYLKEFAGASYTKEEEIDNVKKDSAKAKEAAKRTFIAIKEKEGVKEAAGELAEAAGSVITDAGSIAKTAGSGALNAAKEVKAKYSEDPDTAKDELIANLKKMGQEMIDLAGELAESAKDKIKSAVSEEAEPEEKQEDPGCVPYHEAKPMSDEEEPAEASDGEGCSCGKSDKAEDDKADADKSETAESGSEAGDDAGAECGCADEEGAEPSCEAGDDAGAECNCADEEGAEPCCCEADKTEAAEPSTEAEQAEAAEPNCEADKPDEGCCCTGDSCDFSAGACGLTDGSDGECGSTAEANEAEPSAACEDQDCGSAEPSSSEDESSPEISAEDGPQKVEIEFVSDNEGKDPDTQE